MSRFTVMIETVRLMNRDTKEAIYIRHPTQPLRCLFLPREAITYMSKGEKGFWSIEIPESLAIEKGI